MNKNSSNLLVGKGKEFSAVAVETKQQLQNWLDASGITEGKLLQQLNSGDFQITLNKEKNGVFIYIHQGANLLIEPLVWVKESNILFSHFKVEAGLLLMLVLSKCTNKKAQEIIRNFVRVNLSVK